MKIEIEADAFAEIENSMWKITRAFLDALKNNPKLEESELIRVSKVNGKWQATGHPIV